MTKDLELRTPYSSTEVEGTVEHSVVASVITALEAIKHPTSGLEYFRKLTGWNAYAKRNYGISDFPKGEVFVTAKQGTARSVGSTVEVTDMAVTIRVMRKASVGNPYDPQDVLYLWAEGCTAVHNDGMNDLFSNSNIRKVKPQYDLRYLWAENAAGDPIEVLKYEFTITIHKSH